MGDNARPMRHTPTVKQLRAFHAVYRSGKISAAADELALTQSAVSMLLKDLERTLDVVLFDRTTRALHATDAAHALAGPAQRLLAELAGLAGELRLQTGVRGRVRVAVTPALAQVLMPPALQRMRQEHPEMRVVMEDCAPEQFVGTVLSEAVDFGIGILEQPDAQLRTQALLQDQLHLVAPVDSVLMDTTRPIRWSTLARQPLVLVKPGYGIRRQIDRAALEADVQLDVVHQVSLYSTALAMSRHGLGATILPASMLGEPGLMAGLRARKLVAPAVARSVSLVIREGHSVSEAGRAFLKAVRASFPARLAVERDPGSAG